MKGRRALAVLALAVAAPCLGFAQGAPGYYERLYGAPVSVSITDLINSGSFYTNRAIRTEGRLSLEMAGERGYALEDAFGGKLPIVPKAEIAQEFESEARFKVGRDYRVTGILVERPPQVQNPAAVYVIEFWSYELPPDRAAERLAHAK